MAEFVAKAIKSMQEGPGFLILIALLVVLVIIGYIVLRALLLI